MARLWEWYNNDTKVFVPFDADTDAKIEQVRERPPRVHHARDGREAHSHRGRRQPIAGANARVPTCRDTDL
jgi:hypothetical protein